jgi:hypothetical protein
MNKFLKLIQYAPAALAVVKKAYTYIKGKISKKPEAK